LKDLKEGGENPLSALSWLLCKATKSAEVQASSHDCEDYAKSFKWFTALVDIYDNHMEMKEAREHGRFSVGTSGSTDYSSPPSPQPADPCTKANLGNFADLKCKPPEVDRSCLGWSPSEKWRCSGSHP